MRSFRLLSVLAAMAMTVGLLAPAATAASTTPTRMIIGFSGDRLPADLAASLTALGVTSAVGFETITAVAVTAPAEVMDQLLARPDVIGARAERQIELDLASSVPYIGADRASLDAPQDYTVDTAGKGKKKDQVTGTRPAIDGSGSTVAVLDTGIFDLHPDLNDRVVAHRNFELSYAADLLLTGEQLDAFALATGDSARTDDIGHGTHVAGIVAGTGRAAQNLENNNRGVAPGAKLVDLRIAAGPAQGFVDDTGWERNAIAAFDWLARHHTDTTFGINGIKVNTNSWGLTGTDTVYGAPDYDPLAQIIRQVDGQGIVTVFSAGNDGAEDNVTNDTIPNGMPEVISVAASCKPGAIQRGCDAAPEVNDIGDFSSRGPAVDIAAPGVEIVSAVSANAVGALAKACPPEGINVGGVPCLLYRGDYGDAPEDELVNYAWYGSLHGTSMAGPHIAGAAALILQANPDLTTNQVQVIMAATADDRQAPGRDIEAGWGLIDVQEALIAATRIRNGESMSQVFPGFTWAS